MCPFCGNPITDEFWAEMHAHFDEESKELERDIGALIEQINAEINKGIIDDSSLKLQLYSEYMGKYDVAKAELDKKVSEYYQALKELIDQLNIRLNSISITVAFSSDKKCDNDIDVALDKVNAIINENNSR